MQFTTSITDTQVVKCISEYTFYLLNLHSLINQSVISDMNTEYDNVQFNHSIPYNTEHIVCVEEGLTISVKQKKNMLENNRHDYEIEIIIGSDTKESVDKFISNSIIFYHTKFNLTQKNCVVVSENETFLKSKISLESVFIDEQTKANLLDEIKHFYNSREMYKKFNLPYNKIFLLHGDLSMIYQLVLALSSELSKVVYSVEYFDVDEFYLKNNYISNTFLYVNNLQELKSNFINNLINGMYDFDGTVIFLTTVNIKKVKSLMKKMNSIVEVKNNDEIIIKKIYTEMTGNDDCNEFYDKIKKNKIDISTLQQFLLKPAKQQKIENLIKLMKLKEDNHNNMYA